MGYSRADKAQSHERIVKAAAARFREKGIDGIGLADLMKEAGLTHGGFYRHFESRDALVAEAVDCALRASDGTLTGVVDETGVVDMVRYIEAYLSAEHRDNPGTGCAMAALAGDVARSGPQARALYTAHIERVVSSLVPLLGERRPLEQRRAHALVIVTTLSGALAMARATNDPRLSDEMLEATRRQLIGELERAGATPVR
ncbi:MAG TPA: TetR/AcrR family transcriptional regulator [Pararobbsia sp.]|nr:TetR/AcrR family transcriptional regulator [Pararobbsia sp.]